MKKVDTKTDLDHGKVLDMNESVLELIRREYPSMSKGQKSIAQYVLNHFEDAVFAPAAKLGELTGVSESTVVRFATSLGFEGYPEFLDAMQFCAKSMLAKAEKLDTKFSQEEQSQIVRDVIFADMENMQETLQQLNPEAFEQAVDVLLKADTVYIMGLRSNQALASFLHFYLNMFRGKVILLQSSSISETFEQMLRIGPKDVFVGISFPRYSMRTLRCMEFANARNAKVISITNTVHSPMNLYSSCNLLACSKLVSIADSLVAPMSVINALIVALYKKAPGKAKEHFQMLEEVWDNYQMYSNDEIDVVDDEILQNLTMDEEN